MHYFTSTTILFLLFNNFSLIIIIIVILTYNHNFCPNWIFFFENYICNHNFLSVNRNLIFYFFPHKSCSSTPNLFKYIFSPEKHVFSLRGRSETLQSISVQCEYVLTGFLCNCCSSGTHRCCMGCAYFTGAGPNAVWISWQDHQIMESWSLWEHLHWYIGATDTSNAFNKTTMFIWCWI